MKQTTHICDACKKVINCTPISFSAGHPSFMRAWRGVKEGHLCPDCWELVAELLARLGVEL